MEAVEKYVEFKVTAEELKKRTKNDKFDPFSPLLQRNRILCIWLGNWLS